MRDRDGRDSAKCKNSFDRGIIEQTNTVPEYISFWCANQQRALSDRKGRDSADTSQMRSDLFNAIMIFFLHLRDRRPALSLLPDILPFIFTNKTMPRSCGAFSILDSTSGTNVICHDSLLGSDGFQGKKIIQYGSLCWGR